MYTFILRDKRLQIPKDEFSNLTDESWFLSDLVNCTKDDKDIILYEDYNVVMSIIESLRFNKFIILDGVNPNHMYCLCDKWCVPEWLLEESKKNIKHRQLRSTLCNFLDNQLNSDIINCYNCKTGFKKSENTSISCHYHSGQIICLIGKRVWSCCNTLDDSYGCKLAYHVAHPINSAMINNVINSIKNILD